jgi:HJR/Mrr/RecB family endonuclease
LQNSHTSINNDLITSIDEVDLMSGIEFEEFLCDLFIRMGFSTNKTPVTGDQGIDIIAAKNSICLGIQAKCYSNTVSNKSVQEVASGIKHYRLSKAIELARSNDVVLWDRTILKEKNKEIYLN